MVKGVQRAHQKTASLPGVVKRRPPKRSSCETFVKWRGGGGYTFLAEGATCANSQGDMWLERESEVSLKVWLGPGLPIHNNEENTSIIQTSF